MTGARREDRLQILASFGAAGPVAEELLGYTANDLSDVELPALPPAPEPHVPVWAEYAAEAGERGAWPVLRDRLVQLRFPVAEGISQTEVYRDATRKGIMPCGANAPAGLALRAPDRLRLWVHDSPAGPIPVLCPAERDDFVRLVQALSYRNEPRPVPASMGACLISGLNNWDRVRRYRELWEARRAETGSSATWAEEFRRLVPRKDQYQDRLIVLSEGDYSNVSAPDMGLPADEWRRLSLAVRLGHECTHYLTLRLFGRARNHLLDEVIADYAGLIAAAGRYRADWFLRFVGLEEYPRYRPGGRLENYRGEPPLSEKAFRVVQALVRAAADNLERLEAVRPAGELALWIAALYRGALEELASPAAEEIIQIRLAASLGRARAPRSPLDRG